MKAAVYHGPRDIRVEELPMPAIAADEVLIGIPNALSRERVWTAPRTS